MKTEKEWLEKRIGRKLEKEEPVFRSCWKCNPVHKHLKKADYLIYCFVCEKYFLRGEEIK